MISTRHARRVREIMADGNVRHVHLLDAINEVESGAILVLPQRLTAGFSLGKVLVLTDSEIFGWQPTQSRLNTKRRGRKAPEARKFSQKSDGADRFGGFESRRFRGAYQSWHRALRRRDAARSGGRGE